ncbi:hypothetical protein SKAU_G00280350 [Synaphobranchus kaupii]|uniref:YqaJ viral recombinase domain-containing protein n=1 Tax=Synaphobranchus kaupii TaxID=118154 RepID=A0A9Q1EX66_SYNKA|nr:hypothetical protein SKAU_G00280350 [Synaphobranchus kaupii]
MAAIRTVEYAEGSQIAFTKAQRKRSADRWGTEHEDKVVEEYTKVMESQHSNLTVRKGGLVVNPHYPWLGASPDGIVICH